MTTQKTTSLSRKIALGLGALVVSTMTVAGAAQAKPKFNLTLQLGNGWGGSGFSGGSFNCDHYWWKFKKTGNFWYKNKYMKCMGYW